MFTIESLEKMMVDPARSGPLQSRFTIDGTRSNFIEARPIAVEQEDLVGDSIMMKPEVAREAWERAFKAAVPEMIAEEQQQARAYNNLLKNNPRVLGPYGS